MSDNLEGELNLYPNPTNGHFTIQMNFNDNSNTEAQVQICNLLGQIVIEEQGSVANGVLQKEMCLGEKETAGIYFVRIVHNGEIFNRRLVYKSDRKQTYSLGNGNCKKL